MITIQKLEQTINFLKERGFTKVDKAIILGTGLGQLVDSLEDTIEISYNDIPNFPVSTVEFHNGVLHIGTFAGQRVIVMQGRFHLYEGYDFFAITFPVRVLEGLGVKQLFISNAAGAINLSYSKGDLMLLDDHINLQGGSPLAFMGVNTFGERFVDMSRPYDKELNSQALKVARDQDITMHKGVYACVVGPQLETRAEYRYLSIIGADAVGMSTVPEVIVANQLNMRVVAVSILTDLCDPNHLEPIDVPEIIKIAAGAEPKLVTLFKGLINHQIGIKKAY